MATINDKNNYIFCDGIKYKIYNFVMLNNVNTKGLFIVTVISHISFISLTFNGVIL